ncbi:MAG: Spy/CpxP family protein refolding chaperone [Pseudomonadota bacterium]
MRKFDLNPVRFVLFPLLASALILPACASNPPPPPEPPPPAVTAPAPAPPPPPPPPAPVAAEAPPPETPKPHHMGHHGMLELFSIGLDALELTPEQKTTVDALKVDMAKHAEAPKEPREKLEADVIAGVSAGKIDHAKTDADIKAMSAAVAATQPAMQEDMNRLYKALTPEQRKKLIETMREKGKEMHEHEGMERPGTEHEQHAGPHVGIKDNGNTGPGAAMHEHERENRGAMEHPHEGAGPEGVLGKLTDDLGLTPEQKDKLRMKLGAQMETQHAAMKSKMTTIMKHMDAVGTAFEGDKFDAKKAGVGADAPDMLKAIASAKVQFVETVLSVLTAEQRPKLAAHLQAHAGEME